MHPHSALVLGGYGAEAGDFRARQLVESMAPDPDLTLTMTREDRREVLRYAPRALARTFTFREAADLVRLVGDVQPTARIWPHEPENWSGTWPPGGLCGTAMRTTTCATPSVIPWTCTSQWGTSESRTPQTPQRSRRRSSQASVRGRVSCRGSTWASDSGPDAENRSGVPATVRASATRIDRPISTAT